MARLIMTTAAALAILAAPALARAQESKDAPNKPVTEREPNAVDVVATPASDLNIKKNEIPELLRAAEVRPYVLQGLSTCRQLATAIGELDAVLGDDVDLPQTGERKVSAGRVAQSVVGSFIPFRGLIREISGANKHERELQAAILAGVARRSFLKGIGQQKGCRYPARSATLEIYDHRMAAIEKGEEPWRPDADEAEPQDVRRDRRGPARSVRFTAQPVVQRTD